MMRKTRGFCFFLLVTDFQEFKDILMLWHCNFVSNVKPTNHTSQHIISTECESTFQLGTTTTITSEKNYIRIIDLNYTRMVCE